MAYAPARSCNKDLDAGMTDGTWKKAYPNRGGNIEGDEVAIRRCMSGIWHGFNESDLKILPDGREVHTIDYTNVSCADREYM